MAEPRKTKSVRKSPGKISIKKSSTKTTPSGKVKTKVKTKTYSTKKKGEHGYTTINKKPITKIKRRDIKKTGKPLRGSLKIKTPASKYKNIGPIGSQTIKEKGKVATRGLYQGVGTKGEVEKRRWKSGTVKKTVRKTTRKKYK